MRALTERLAVWVAVVMGAAAFLGAATLVVLSGGPARSQASPSSAVEPYGGCKEAWQAPRSPGARQCRRLGWTVSARFLVDPRGVVVRSTLPHCRQEDGSGGRRPCTWNVGRRVDGNGVGAAYKVRRDMSVRYVWPASPAVRGWRWVGGRRAYDLARHFQHRAQRRTFRAWQRCVFRDAAVTRVRCPDGVRYRV